MSSPQKYAAKRAEKFREQDGRLSLVALELTYVFGGIAHAQRGVIVNEMIPQTRAELSDLKAFQDKPEAWCNGKGYWDDYCLCRFLEGVCERYLAYPVRTGRRPPALDTCLHLSQDPDAVVEEDGGEKSRVGAEERATAAFEAVLSHGAKIQGDHHLVFHTRTPS